MQINPVIEIDENGNKEWFLNGELHRTDGPAVELANGDKFWYLNGKFHRTDGPAVEYSNGDKFWYLNGKFHRTDGPAVEFTNGDKHWFLHDNMYSFEEWIGLSPLSEKEKLKLSLQYVQ